MSLLTDLQTAGLTVRPNPGWETATNGGDRKQTVGILNHWDAIKGTPDVSRYLWDNRFGGILYHVIIRRDGTLDLLSQRYVWHAGMGSSAILSKLEQNIEVPPDVPGPDDTNGNPHMFGVCINYHPDEGPVPAAQYEALVQTNRVLIDHFGLTTNQVVRHMDWTTRKRDIDTIDLDQFRQDITEETDMLPIGPGSATEDIRSIQGLLNTAFNAGLVENGSWDAATKTAASKHLGSSTGDPSAKAGEYVNARMYRALLIGLVRAVAPQPGDTTGFSKVGHEHSTISGKVLIK